MNLYSFSSDIMSVSTRGGNDTINTTQSSLGGAVIHGGDGTDVFNLTASALDYSASTL